MAVNGFVVCRVEYAMQVHNSIKTIAGLEIGKPPWRPDRDIGCCRLEQAIEVGGDELHLPGSTTALGKQGAVSGQIDTFVRLQRCPDGTLDIGDGEFPFE